MVKARSGNPPGFAMLASLTLHSNALTALTDNAIIDDKADTDSIFLNFIISSVRFYRLVELKFTKNAN